MQKIDIKGAVLHFSYKCLVIALVIHEIAVRDHKFLFMNPKLFAFPSNESLFTSFPIWYLTKTKMFDQSMTVLPFHSKLDVWRRRRKREREGGKASRHMYNLSTVSIERGTSEVLFHF